MGLEPIPLIAKIHIEFSLNSWLKLNASFCVLRGSSLHQYITQYFILATRQPFSPKIKPDKPSANFLEPRSRAHLWAEKVVGTVIAGERMSLKSFLRVKFLALIITFKLIENKLMSSSCQLFRSTRVRNKSWVEKLPSFV